MDLRFAKSGNELIASVDCNGEPRTLQSGNPGWFEVSEIAWRNGWHVRVEVSVTAITRPSYGGSWSGNVKVDVSSHCLVTIAFTVPDALSPFKKKRGWGGADEGPIRIGSGRHHCSARVRARNPDVSSYLDRVGSELRFYRSVGDARLLEVMKDVVRF